MTRAAGSPSGLISVLASTVPYLAWSTTITIGWTGQPCFGSELNGIASAKLARLVRALERHVHAEDLEDDRVGHARHVLVRDDRAPLVLIVHPFDEDRAGKLLSGLAVDGGDGQQPCGNGRHGNDGRRRGQPRRPRPHREPRPRPPARPGGARPPAPAPPSSSRTLSMNAALILILSRVCSTARSVPGIAFLSKNLATAS